MANKIIYYDIAVGAKEHGTMKNSNGEALDCSAGVLAGVMPENYATFEGDGIDLTDTELCFPSQQYIGFVSNEVSENTSLPSCEVTVDFGENYYSGKGVTIFFWQQFCHSVKITYYHDNSVLDSSTYYCNSLEPFFEKNVELYNKVKFEFQTDSPYYFVKFYNIAFGETISLTDFFDFNVFEEIAPFCDDLPACTCDFDAVIPRENFAPAENQTVYAYHGDKLLGKFNVESFEKVTGNRYRFECVDDIGLLEDAVYSNGFSQGTVTVPNFLSTVLSGTGITVSSDSFNGESVTGFTEANKSVRFNLAQLAFALGVNICPRRTDTLRLFQPYGALGFRFAEPTSTINGNRIIGNAKIEKRRPFTSFDFYKYNGSTAVSDVESFANTLLPSGSKKNIKEFKGFTEVWGGSGASSHGAEREEYIRDLGWQDTEIKARIILEDEQAGDFVKIKDKDGVYHYGIIKSLDISVRRNRLIADAVIKEVKHDAF